MGGELEGVTVGHLLTRLLLSAPEAIVMADIRGTITFWNHGAERLFGYTDGEAVGRGYQMLVPEERRDEALGIWERMLSGRTIEQLETMRQHKLGTLIRVSLDAFPIMDEAGTIVAVAGIARDIGGRKMVEEELRQSQKLAALGELAGGVAHDFNNLLTVVNGHCDSLLAKTPDNHPYFKPLLQIRQSGARAAALTRHLLTFSRKDPAKFSPLDLNAVITEMTNVLHDLLGVDVPLEVDLNPELGLVMADPIQIEQVLLNLAVNARDAISIGGRVRIRTFRTWRHDKRIHEVGVKQEYAVVRVADNGRGIDPQTLQRIFEPFFTTKPVGKGTGLGLSTVYGIVEQHGGNIEVRSEVGLGTTFDVYLPIAQKPLSLPNEVTAGAKPTGSATILLVEDEDSVRDLVAVWLATAGYTVLEAGDGPNALELAEQHEGAIDLVITDVVLPKMHGPALVEVLRRMRPQTEALFLSGYVGDDLLRRGVTVDALRYLQKPFSESGLLTHVATLLHNPPA